MKQKFIEEETKFLRETQATLERLVSEFASKNRSEIDDKQESKILGVIERSIQNEVDFLHEDAGTYEDLYYQD